MKPLLTFILLCLISVQAVGQDSLLANFDLIALPNSVELRWTMKKGNTCNGITVFRSGDSLHFNEIGDIPGICGNPEFAEAFRYTDSNPLRNQRNYYRLQLGAVGLSEIVAIDFFKLGESDNLLFPNPTSGDAALIIQNLNNTLIDVEVFDVSGHLIWSQSDVQNRFEIPSSNWQNGNYLVHISNDIEETNASLKLIVINK